MNKALETSAATTFAVGQTLPLRCRPTADALEHLEQLANGAATDAPFTALWDRRIARERWPRTLRREFATMLGWLARRLMGATGRIPVGVPRWSGYGSVLVLLPRHGHAVHAIRRALPFAVCGVPTKVAGHDRDLALITEHLRVLRGLLGLTEGVLSHADDTAARAVHALGRSDLVIVTGRPETARDVRAATRAVTLGATGTCTVLTGSDRNRIVRTADLLRRYDQPDSCTRLAGSLVSSDDGTTWLDAGGGQWQHIDESRLLRRLHPTAVYRLTDDMTDSPSSPRELAGYTCLDCDDSGATGTLVGFARDPCHGWPGDYLI